MTEIAIDDLTPRNRYEAAGGETDLDYTFPIFDADHLLVQETDPTDLNNPVTLVRGTDYTVTGVNVATGGTIVFDTGAYPSGAIEDNIYTITRKVPYERLNDYQFSGDFESSDINSDLDLVIMQIQQLDLRLNATVQLDETDEITVLPIKVETTANRQGALIGFNAAGNQIEAKSLASLSLTGLDTLFSTLSANDFMQYNGTNWVNITIQDLKDTLGIKKNNYVATSAPTVNDDSGDGYAVGSKWIDITNDNVYHCVDATLTAAVWELGDLEASDLGSAAAASLIDDDTFATATSANIPSAESVKAYIDGKHFGAWSNVATTSGTAVAIDEAIPSGTTEIELWVDGISVNGSAQVIFQIGDSGGYETTGYTSVSAITTDGNLNVAETASAGFLIFDSAQVVDAMLMTGPIRLRLIDAASNKWVMDGLIMRTNVANEGGGPCAGSKSLSAELDRIRITTVAGTAAFDAGSVRVRYK